MTNCLDSAWLSDRDLVLRGIPEHAQKAGRESGKLKFSPLGGGSFVYCETDVTSWLASENGTTKGKTFVRTPAPAPAPQQGRPTAPAAGSARATWDQAIRQEIATGKAKAQAVSAVDRKHPGLRERMLAEVNGR